MERFAHPPANRGACDIVNFLTVLNVNLLESSQIPLVLIKLFSYFSYARQTLGRDLSMVQKRRVLTVVMDGIGDRASDFGNADM